VPWWFKSQFFNHQDTKTPRKAGLNKLFGQAIACLNLGTLNLVSKGITHIIDIERAIKRKPGTHTYVEEEENG
jgi:hypothetical protein